MLDFVEREIVAPEFLLYILLRKIAFCIIVVILITIEQRLTMRFIGRERELVTLEDLSLAEGFQMPIIYGRRRVGKTSLINQFIKNKPAVIFTAQETSAKENLASLSRAILELERGERAETSTPSGLSFASFQEAFEHLFTIARKRRIFFAIDEYPYLAQSERAVSSILQQIIDREKDSSHLYLMLCGSSMSFMEHQVLGYKSPLYGRRTAQIKVEPFDIFQAGKLMKGCDAETVVNWYSLVGGIPLYLEQHDPQLDLQQNIAKNFLRTDCFLFGEPDAFLQQELREPARYNAVIRAIAQGAGRLTDIADTAGLETSATTAYLKTLIELGIVAQDQPIIDANRKKARYRIVDNLFRSWYRFVPRYLTPLQAGRERDIARSIMSEQLPTLMGLSFERICKQWLVEHMGEDDIPIILEIGSWWGTDRNTKEEADIDIVARCDDGSFIFGECKWRNRLCGAEVLDTLEKRTTLFPYDRKRFFLFSKSGFTAACEKKANELGCKLISLNDMGISA